MVLAEGIEVNVLLQYHIVILHVKPLFQMLSRIVGVAAGQLLIHSGNAFRRLQQAFPFRIFSDSLQNQTYACFYFFSVH